MKPALLLLPILVLAACGRTTPQINYYRLASNVEPEAKNARAVLAVEPFQTVAAYDDDRIVYRESEYRLDYYYYHRWAAEPGSMVTDFLREAYGSTGRFRNVVGEAGGETTAVLSGRVIALEEVDVTKERWLGRIVLELELRDPTSGEVIWSRVVREEVPLPRRHPEGLAEALSGALDRIARRTAPTIAGTAEALLDRKREPTAEARR